VRLAGLLKQFRIHQPHFRRRRPRTRSERPGTIRDP
jgi:hypothetical protein